MLKMTLRTDKQELVDIVCKLSKIVDDCGHDPVIMNKCPVCGAKSIAKAVKKNNLIIRNEKPQKP